MISHKNNDFAATLNIRRLFVLRNVAIACAIVAILVAVYGLHMALPLIPLAVVIVLHGLVNLKTLHRSRQQPQIASKEIFLQLALDTLVLTALLYFAGGSTNPFVSLFLLPLVIVAAILPQAYAWAMAALTISCYTILMFFYLPLPHAHAQHGADFDFHVLGMWLGFILSAGFILFFVIRMANSIRERDRSLNAAREQALRDQNLVALGTMATGAAHELGTPLATMAVLANELKHEHADDPDVLEKAELLRSQLDRCKSILSDITASAGQTRGEGGGRYALDEYLQSIVKLLKNARPAVQISCVLEGAQPAPQILADKTLTQALLNILNNAADASIDHIELQARWDDKSLNLTVLDYGEGFSSIAEAAAGKPFFTTKAEGQGLGLYLANAVMDRFGGRLQLSNRKEGGAQAVVELPLSAIGVGA